MRGPFLPLLVAALVCRPAAAFGHDKGVIRPAAQEVAAGAELEIRGEKLPKSTEFALVLRGALETHVLGRVRTDTAGAFTAHIVVPATVEPGTYVVRALAPDGDEGARAEIRVIAAPAAASASPEHGAGHEHGGGHEGGAQNAGAEATAEPLELPVRRGPLEWAVILGLSAASLASGLALLRRA